MNVMIKGFEKPASCAKCPLVAYGNGKAYCVQIKSGRELDYELGKDAVMSFCPLIPVHFGELTEKIKKRLYAESENVRGNDMIETDRIEEILVEVFENAGLYDREEN